MKAKVDNLSELSSVLSKKEKTSCGNLGFTKQFKLGLTKSIWVHFKLSFFYLRGIFDRLFNHV